MKERIYAAVDLKSFYASVECVERGLDPLTTNLVVADLSRTEKTICLAVTPSLKAYGISGRARLFEVVQKVAEVNAQRRLNAPRRQLTGSSWHDPDVKAHPELALDYLVAPPRMAHYIECPALLMFTIFLFPSLHIFHPDFFIELYLANPPVYTLHPFALCCVGRYVCRIFNIMQKFGQFFRDYIIILPLSIEKNLLRPVPKRAFGTSGHL